MTRAGTIFRRCIRGLLLVASCIAGAAEPAVPPAGLPLLRLDTTDATAIDSTSRYVGGTISLSAAGMVDPFGRPAADLEPMATKVRGRGNTTWDYPKKPYRLKLDEPADILGMGAARNWVLLADYIDPTGLRNAVAFELGRRLGVPFTPGARHVNLVLNGTHRGLYLLAEHPEVAANRVVTDSHEGYLVEFDDYPYPGEEIFSTPIVDLPLKIKFPDVAKLDGEARAAAVARVLGIFRDFEMTIAGPAGPGDYESLADVDSLVDWFLVHEITHNYEPQHPKSCFFHRAADGRIAAGPLWDFDYAYDYEPPATDALLLREKFWFPHLFKDPGFRSRLKARWRAVKARHVDTLPAYLETLAAGIRDSVDRDRQLWPCDDEIRCPADATALSRWLAARIPALDAAIEAVDGEPVTAGKEPPHGSP